MMTTNTDRSIGTNSSSRQRRRQPLRWRAAAAKAALKYHTMDNNNNIAFLSRAKEERQKEEEKAKRTQQQSSCCCCSSSDNNHWFFLDVVAVAAVSSSLMTLMAATMETENEQQYHQQRSSSMIATATLNTACALTMGLGPLVSYQGRKLRHLGSLRNIHNCLREETNYFMRENERLHRTMGRLESSVHRLEQVEDQLEVIAGGNRSNVSRMVDIVERQQEVLTQMKKHLKSQLIQQVLTILMQIDRNEDLMLNSSELETLILRLKLMEGVYFNESRFRKRFCCSSKSNNNNNNLSLTSIMKLFRSLLQKDKPDGDDIFTLHPEQLLLLEASS